MAPIGHVWAGNQVAEAVSTEGGAVNSVVLPEACVRAKDREDVPERLSSLGIELIALPVSASKAFVFTWGAFVQKTAKDRAARFL